MNLLHAIFALCGLFGSVGDVFLFCGLLIIHAACRGLNLQGILAGDSEACRTFVRRKPPDKFLLFLLFGVLVRVQSFSKVRKNACFTYLKFVADT